MLILFAFLALSGVVWLRRPQRLALIPPGLARSRWMHALDFWLRISLVGLSVVGLAWVARVESLHSVEAAVAESEPAPLADGAAQGSVAEIGRALFGPFALPFEIASLVLLAAIVGAVVLARKRGS